MWQQFSTIPDNKVTLHYYPHYYLYFNEKCGRIICALEQKIKVEKCHEMFRTFKLLLLIVFSY